MLIRIKTLGKLIDLNTANISIVKASVVGKNEYVAVVVTQDYKTITLDLVGSPFSTSSECLDEAQNYLEQGGEQ